MLEERKVKIFLLTLIIALTAGIAVKAFVGFKAAPVSGPETGSAVQAQPQNQSQPQTQTQLQASLQGQEIVVYVTGAVTKSGLVKLAPGARLADALEAAGQTAEADISSLNLAEKLRDGEKIVVPRAGEVQAQTQGQTPTSSNSALASSPAGAGSQNGKININTAGAAELDTLPGIGPALAGRIITYRDDNGPFNQIDELKQVPGIGDKKFADVQDMVTVN